MTSYQSPHRPLFLLASGLLVVAALYFAQAVLIPIALAILLAFLLSPIVEALQKRGLGTAAPAFLVVSASLVLLGGLAIFVSLQVRSLVEQLPSYKDNILEKVATLRDAQDGPISDVAQETLQEIAGELDGDDATVEKEPLPVTIEQQSSPVLRRLPTIIEALAAGGLVIVLVLFLLLGRKQLRDRLIFFFGRRHLTVTTKALDEAGARISRYLLMQALVNGGFGICLGIALFALGVDYALLWGFFGAVLRFIPYVGPWLAAAMPITLSLAIFPGWNRPLLVIGVYILLELATNMLVEPLVYGKSAGVSAVALLVAIAFWTWLWGPIGMLLATPLTVCLFVIGKYVPQLEYIALLMGDEPVSQPDVKFYQRLLAKDEDEALQIVETFQHTGSPEEVPDALLLPALVAAKRDHGKGRIDDDDMHFVLRATHRILETLECSSAPGDELPERPLVLGCPASDESDLVALQMLQCLVRRAGRCELELLGNDMLISEAITLIDRRKPAVICIGSLPPGGLSRALHLCKRLRAHDAEVRIVVGRWGLDEAAHAGLLLDGGADRAATTLLETRKELHELGQLVPPTVPLSPARTA